jgi:hypothetical protein
VPVDLLLCEGGANSPDIRLLRRLLTGYCGEIRAMGGKYGMGPRILARRESTGAKVAGLLDGDFLHDWPGRSESPRSWQTENGGITFGWRWSRKEIENYLIDPTVVSRSLGAAAPSSADYVKLLEAAADKICFYQAARTALGNCRKRFRDLPSNWGHPRGRDGHPFPDDATETGCQTGIGQVVTDHGADQTVTSAQVLARYGELLPAFTGSGQRRLDFMWTFAGKDLLAGAAGAAAAAPSGADSGAGTAPARGLNWHRCAVAALRGVGIGTAAATEAGAVTAPGGALPGPAPGAVPGCARPEPAPIAAAPERRAAGVGAGRGGGTARCRHRHGAGAGPGAGPEPAPVRLQQRGPGGARLGSA